MWTDVKDKLPVASELVFVAVETRGGPAKTAIMYTFHVAHYWGEDGWFCPHESAQEVFPAFWMAIPIVPREDRRPVREG